MPAFGMTMVEEMTIPDFSGLLQNFEKIRFCENMVTLFLSGYAQKAHK